MATTPPLRGRCALAEEHGVTGTRVGVDDWVDYVAFMRETFINDLVQQGYRLTGDNSQGAESDAVLAKGQVTILIADGFPYRPPRVLSEEPGPASCHRDRRGEICLYTERDHDGQPWLDVEAFIARIDEWFTKTAQGWPNDPPALDLEAYLGLPADERFVLYADLTRYPDGYVTLRDGHPIQLVAAQKVPKRSKKGKLSGYLTNIGEVITPPTDWEELVSRSPDAERIVSAIDRGRLDVLLIRYSRADQNGVVALTFVHKDSEQECRKQGKSRTGGRSHRRRSSNASHPERKPKLAFCGSSSDATMRLRSGSAAPDLKDKHVYVVGAGALGSHICDGLVRAGLGNLTVRDQQTLTPGNMTRHLVGDLRLVGHSKAHAVVAVLRSAPYSRAKMQGVDTALVSPIEAVDLLRNYDLVIDATADGSVTNMLEAAAEITGTRIVTACLQNEGRSMRIDIVPPLDGAQPLPPTKLVLNAAADEMFEGGCGLPVSPTPPFAVAECAAMTVRHCVALLTGVPESSAGEHRDLNRARREHG